MAMQGRIRKTTRRGSVRIAAIVLLAVAAALGGLFALCLRDPGSLRKAQRLVDQGPGARATAIRILAKALQSGELQTPARVGRAVRILDQILDRRNAPEVRALAFEVLLDSRHPASMGRLAETVGLSAYPEELRLRILDGVVALAKAGHHDVDAQKTLADLLRDAETSVRIRTAIARSLKHFWGRKMTAALTEVASDAESPTPLRIAAVQTLGDFLTQDGPGVAVMLRLFGAEDEAVAGAAREALERARTRASIETLAGLTSAADGHARTRASDLRSHREDARARWKTRTLLAPPGEIKTSPFPQAELFEEDPGGAATDQRLAAIWALIQRGGSDSKTGLKAYLQDDEPVVRRAAARAIERIEKTRKEEAE